jgi:hypothetical protein
MEQRTKAQVTQWEKEKKRKKKMESFKRMAIET